MSSILSLRSVGMRAAGSSLLVVAVLLTGLFGNVSSAHAESNAAPGAAPAAKSAGIVANALKYKGYRYRYGGSSPASGFDCTGFVYYVYKSAGYAIPRDMYSMYNSGARVSTKNLQPGDIIFFSGTYKRGLSHAAIYIGNGRIIHAANESTGVLVSDLWSPYWAAHYTGAVRP
jgi:cell wall-associated NlpC family hydrolase